MLLAQLFRPRLRSLQAGSLCRWPERSKAMAVELIHEPCHEWSFGPHHGEVDPLTIDQVRDAPDVLACRRREVVEEPRAPEVSGPTLHVLVHGFGLVDDRLVRGEVLVSRPFVAVCDADLDDRKIREHIEL